MANLLIHEADIVACIGDRNHMGDIALTIEGLPKIKTLTVTDTGSFEVTFHEISGEGYRYHPDDLKTELQKMKEPKNMHHRILRYWESYHNYRLRQKYEKVPVRTDVERGPDVMQATMFAIQDKRNGTIVGTKYTSPVLDGLLPLKEKYEKWLECLRAAASGE
ncbi:MAG: hypothetical protein Q9216_006383 [Gyalolechia sp. 2 TL-2023]